MHGQKADELKGRIEKIKRFYFKGFDAALIGLDADAHNYCDYPEDREGDKEHILSIYGELERFYQGIPFGEIMDENDFAPLFVVRNLLPRLKTEIDALLDNPISQKADELHAVALDIMAKGLEYRRALYEAARDLSEMEGNENFHVELTDRLGRRYLIPLLFLKVGRP